MNLYIKIVVAGMTLNLNLKNVNKSFLLPLPSYKFHNIGVGFSKKPKYMIFFCI